MSCLYLSCHKDLSDNFQIQGAILELASRLTALEREIAGKIICDGEFCKALREGWDGCPDAAPEDYIKQSAEWMNAPLGPPKDDKDDREIVGLSALQIFQLCRQHKDIADVPFSQVRQILTDLVNEARRKA